jgi:hypothetical protein
MCPCLEHLVQVLQHEIRRTHPKGLQVEWVTELQLLETIGKGGFGVVYKGTWKNSLAAIKVRTRSCFKWPGVISLCEVSSWPSVAILNVQEIEQSAQGVLGNCRCHWSL